MKILSKQQIHEHDIDLSEAKSLQLSSEPLMELQRKWEVNREITI